MKCLVPTKVCLIHKCLQEYGKEKPPANLHDDYTYRGLTYN